MSLLCAVTHTNEDAAKKWCPFSWTRNTSWGETALPGTENPSGKGQNHSDQKAVNGGRCLTNSCMAWIDETDHVHEIAIGRCGLITLAGI